MTEPTSENRPVGAGVEPGEVAAKLQGTQPGEVPETAALPPPPSEEDVEREERQCMVEDLATGAIRFTRTGFREYGPRFAQAGIDINGIKSKTDFKEACLRSEYIVWRQLRDRIKENPALMAIMQDFFDRYCAD
jgi:hypothetical protein